MSHDQLSMGDTGMDICCLLPPLHWANTSWRAVIYSCLIQAKLDGLIRSPSSECGIGTKRPQSPSGKSLEPVNLGWFVPWCGQGTHREDELREKKRVLIMLLFPFVPVPCWLLLPLDSETPAWVLTINSAFFLLELDKVSFCYNQGF